MSIERGIQICANELILYSWRVYKGEKQVKLKAKNRNDSIFAVQHHWDMLI
jgi:hypothetical protein